MPRRPAASTTENVRYGLHAGSGARNSIRVDSDLPFFVCGTLTTTDRLFLAHEMDTGASKPTTRRLYEFTHWLVIALISRAWRKTPAMNPRPIFDSPYGSPASWKAFVSPSNSEKCVCIPEPCTCSMGFGMNVACTPWTCAT